MAKLKKNLAREVERLYQNECLSVQKVADKMGVSIDAVFYCMRKNNIPRRQSWESNAINYARSKPSFKLKKIKNEKMRILKAMGTMLYWGEGCKSDKTSIIDFANSDPDMIKLFLKFLREICGINESKLSVYPYFYVNQDKNKNIRHWSKITKIKKSRFSKPYIRKDFKEEKKDKMPYGLIHIRYSDKKLLNLIRNWIDEYKKF